MSTKNTQIGGSHYKDMAIQPTEYITKNNLGYIEGNIIKYISRYKSKNGLEDLKKARHYIDMLIEGYDDLSEGQRYTGWLYNEPRALEVIGLKGDWVRYRYLDNDELQFSATRDEFRNVITKKPSYL